MKTIRNVLIIAVLAAVLFASTVSAFAINFVAEETYESVFVIHSGNSLGSGFALGSNCVITNAHVIQDARHITVRSYDGTERSATVLGMDEDQDIAVLVVAGAQYPTLTVADMQLMQTGDDVYAIGAPKSMAYTLTKGVISAKERKVGRHTYIQIDAPINEGNSGGPLLNASGQVLGMNTLKMNDSEGIGMAIPIDRICLYLESLGVVLNDSGNVPEGITPSEPENQGQLTVPTETVDVPPQTPDYTIQADTSFIAWAVAGVSLVLNVILLALLLIKKQKNIKVQDDPSERTDFEIDILE